MKIAAIKKSSTKEAVIEALQDYIVNNQLTAGDPFPPEQTLARTLGVSRNILREALQSFRTLGIIESKPKTGAVVRELLPSNPFAGYLPYMESERKNLNDILETRRVIEIGIASILVEKSTREHWDELRSIAKKFETCAPETRPELDIRFHSILLEISGNAIILSLKSLVVDFFEKTIAAKNDSRRTKKPKHIAEEHLAVVTAMENGDVVLLQQAINAHYQGEGETNSQKLESS